MGKAYQVRNFELGGDSFSFRNTASSFGGAKQSLTDAEFDDLKTAFYNLRKLQNKLFSIDDDLGSIAITCFHDIEEKL